VTTFREEQKIICWFERKIWFDYPTTDYSLALVCLSLSIVDYIMSTFLRLST